MSRIELPSVGGGSATTDASQLTSGILPAARIADGSIADAKLASGTSLTAAERAKLAGIATSATANRSDAATDALLAAKAVPLTRTGVKTANYTAAMWDLVPCDTSGGAFTVTLPAASSGKGRIALKLVTAGNPLTVALTGSDHINTSAGPTTGSLSLANQGMILESDGSGIWTITADDLALTQLDARYDAAGAAAAKATALTPTAVKTSAYTAADGDVVLADATSAGFTVTLPAATAKRIVAVRKVDSSANVVTVAPTAGTIDGSGTRTLVNQWQTQTYIADGTNWHRMTVPGVTGIAATGSPSSTTYLRGDGTWSTPAAGSVATDVIYDAKGDLPVGTGADTAARLAVGTDGHGLVADSTQTTGVKWAPRSRVADEVHADTTLVNSTTETDVVSLTIPTSAAAGDIVRLSIWADQINNTAGNVTYEYRLKIGTTTVLDTGALTAATSASRGKVAITADILIESTSAQRVRATIIATRGTSSWAAGSAVLAGAAPVGYGTAAEDLTSAKTVRLSVQMSVASASADFVVHGATLEIIKKA